MGMKIVQTTTESGPPVGAHPGFQIVSIGETPGLQYPRGFGPGHHFFGKTDANNRIVPEVGPNSRVFYVRNGGFTEAQIEAAESISISNIANWIRDQPTSGLSVSPARYGETEALAIDVSLINSVVGAIWPSSGPVDPLIIYLKSGETFDRLPRPRTTQSPLYPMIITTYDGDAPATIFDPDLSQIQEPSNFILENLIFDRTAFQVVSNDQGKNMQLHRCENTGFGATITFRGFEGQELTRVTLSDHFGHGVLYETPKGYGTALGFWADANADRVEAVYLAHIEGMLITDSVFDLNSHDPNYASDRSYPPGQIPTQFSHNVYGGESLSDWTNHNVISSRAGNSGMQIRSGSYNCNVGFFDNNIVHQISGVSPADQANWTALIDEIIISAGDKQTDPEPPGYENGPDQFRNYDGGTRWGIGSFFGTDHPMFSLFVLNGEDPNFPEGKTPTGGSHIDLSDSADADRFRIKNSVVWNWFGQPDYGVSGLDTNDLNECTLSYFVDDYLALTPGTTSGTQAALDWIVSQDRPSDYLDDLFEYLAPRLGQASRARLAPATLVMDPDDQGDGHRLINRFNWPGNVYPPGRYETDSMDIDGGVCTHAEGRLVLDDLIFGAGGTFNKFGGTLIVTGTFDTTGGCTLRMGDGSHVHIEGSMTSGTCMTYMDEGSRLVYDTNGLSFNWIFAERESQIVIMGDRNVDIAGVIELNGNAAICLEGLSGETTDLTLAGTLAMLADDEYTDVMPFIGPAITGINGPDANNRPLAPASNRALDITNVDFEVDASGLDPNTYILIDVGAGNLTGPFNSTDVTGGVLTVDVPNGIVSIEVT
jgi:hypothetical protein